MFSGTILTGNTCVTVLVIGGDVFKTSTAKTFKTGIFFLNMDLIRAHILKQWDLF